MGKGACGAASGRGRAWRGRCPRGDPSALPWWESSPRPRPRMAVAELQDSFICKAGGRQAGAQRPHFAHVRFRARVGSAAKPMSLTPTCFSSSWDGGPAPPWVSVTVSHLHLVATNRAGLTHGCEPKPHSRLLHASISSVSHSRDAIDVLVEQTSAKHLLGPRTCAGLWVDGITALKVLRVSGQWSK